MADDPIDRLYGLPLEEFVAARDALAKELRSGGEKERAAEVKKLAKPTRAAWAVNQLARTHAEEVKALVEAGAALSGAQEALLGGAEPAVLRSAAEAARALVDALAAQTPVDGATKDKVRATLHAATVDDEARAEVASGRVLKERAASGFGGLDALVASATPPASARKSGSAKPAGPDPREVRRRRDALRRANEAEAEAESALDGARRSLEQVEATITARKRDLAQAEAALSEARDRRERAEQAAAELDRG
ncbi:hypothetical protein [Baekduia sp. Peel2402]|uniref:hypothetical protein n=1 Tax=Baekduia sp. Peel2402 TaxID=3458296 RepID=UPI00403E47DB